MVKVPSELIPIGTAKSLIVLSLIVFWKRWGLAYLWFGFERITGVSEIIVGTLIALAAMFILRKRRRKHIAVPVVRVVCACLLFAALGAEWYLYVSLLGCCWCMAGVHPRGFGSARGASIENILVFQ